jgi:hypothetical protein
MTTRKQPKTSPLYLILKQPRDEWRKKDAKQGTFRVLSNLTQAPPAMLSHVRALELVVTSGRDDWPGGKASSIILKAQHFFQDG